MDIAELIEKRNLKLTELTELVNTGKVEYRKLSNTETVVFTSMQKDIEAMDAEITNKQTGHNLINNRNTTKKMVEKFSLLKAIEARANGRNLDEKSLEVIEQGKAEMRNAGLSYSGDIQLPMEYRGISATVATAGQETISEDKLGILEPLRETLVLVQAGATFLTGLIGDVSIPVYAGTSALWKGEVAASTAGDGAFSEITMSPKRLTTFIDVSKQFLAQNSPAAEAMLMKDIVAAISGKLENTIFGSAAGSATQPAGFFATAPLDSIGAATFANVVKMETAVDTANALGTAKYITNAGGRGVLKTTPKVAGQAIFILDNNEMNGYPVLVSNHVAKGLQVGVNEFGVVFGDWSQFVIGQWGAIDLVVDGLSQAINGNVRIVVNAYFDAKPRVAAAFKTGSVK